MSSPAQPPTSTATAGPTPTDQNVFNMLFGPQTCVDSPWGTLFWYLGLALVVTFVFALLAYNQVDSYMAGYVANPNARLGAKIVIFFVFFLVIDWLFNMWRENHPVCKEQ
jgi:hypothetical protein